MFEHFFIGVRQHKLNLFLNSIAAIVIISVIESDFFLGLEFYFLILTVGFVSTLISDLVLIPFGCSSDLKNLSIGGVGTVGLIFLGYFIFPVDILRVFVPIISGTIALLIISSTLYNKFKK